MISASRNALLAAALAASLAACSSAPSGGGAVFDVRNKAAEFSKLGDGFMVTGQYDSALGYYDQALRSSRSVDDLEGIAAAQASIGRAYAAAGMGDEARSALEAALEAALASGSAAAEAAALSGKGELLYAAGEPAEALGLFERAVSRVAPGGKEPKEAAAGKAYAVALHDQGVALIALGRVAEARAALEKAQALNAKARRWVELAADRYVLASALAGELRLDEALATALGALEADKNAENGRGIAGDLAAAGKLCERLGRDEEALGYWKRSFDTAVAADEAAVARAALEALIPLAGKLGRQDDSTRYAALLAKLDELRGR